MRATAKGGQASTKEQADHADTASYGKDADAKLYRLRQAKLTEDGKLIDAVNMDIKDIKPVASRAKDSHRYDQATKEIKSYTNCLHCKLNKIR